MKRSKLIQASGSWVKGDRFWDRREELKLFEEKLAEGAHILLAAQRRMGKTSLLHEIARRLTPEYLCLFVDLQAARDAADVIVDLSLAIHPFGNLWRKAQGVFSNVLVKVLEKIDKLEYGDLAVHLRTGLSSSNWAKKGDELLSILAAYEKPVVLLLDEVPILVNRILKDEDYLITPERKKAANDFMSWLRKNSIKHQGKIRMVISGSIGLEPILHQAGLSATINNFSTFELKPWNEEAALGCLDALANQYGVKFEPGCTAEILKCLGYNIPHYVQMFFDRIYDRCKRKHKMKVTRQEVKLIYQEELLGNRGHSALSHYEERLKSVLGEQWLPIALDMLSEAAVNKSLSREALKIIKENYQEIASVNSIQNDILDVLVHEGYLKPIPAKAPKSYVFVSRLLRDWWKARYKFIYQPVGKGGR